jgi:hypothetical protein
MDTTTLPATATSNGTLGVTAEVATITPDVAKAMLANNTVNRRLRPQRIKLYAKYMRAGKWRLTGETIVFSPSGQLLQGQHRLSACVAADVPFQSVVIRGIDPEAMKVMDTGAARTAADMFGIEGIPERALQAATVRYLIGIKAGVARDTSRMNLITRDELLDFYHENQEPIEEAVQLARATYGALRFSRAGWTALAFLLAETDRDMAHEFMEGLGTGAGMEVGDPRLALRAWVLNRTAQRQSLHWTEQVANGIKTWNNWIENRQVGHLKGWKPVQPWPEIAA